VSRKHKRKVEKQIGVSLSAMVTPMLDMSFQLLNFFILTFKIMPTEGQLSINLPKVDATDSPPPLEPLPPEDKKDEYTITVHAGAGGEVALLGLKGPTVNSDNIKNFGDLLAQLKAIPKPAGRGAEGVSITIESANDLIYARLIDIMDLCKRAGYDSVNLMPMRKERG
jgi:biopolymer transport protein ExbD